MKILFLSRRFYPDIGGVEKHVYEISSLLVKDGHKVTIITQSPGKEKIIKGIRIFRIPRTSRNTSEKIHVWKWFWNNRNLINGADIVHAHDVYWWYWPYRFLFLSKKSFVTFHGYESYPIRTKAIIFRRLSAFLATGSIAVGKFIEKWYGTKADFAIYGGVNASGSSKVRTIKSKAIFIGRLDKDTGILKYLEAEKIIKSNVKTFKFIVIGEGKYKNKVSIKNQRDFTQKYIRELGSSEIVFSSSYLMILEALSLKKPIFSVYDTDLKKDYLTKTPFSNFINISGTSKKLSEQVMHYFNTPDEFKNKIESGHKWVINQTWENIINNYYQLWKYN